MIDHCYLWSISWTSIPELLFPTPPLKDLALWDRDSQNPEGKEAKEEITDWLLSPSQAVYHRDHFHSMETRVQMPLKELNGHVPSRTLGLVCASPMPPSGAAGGTYILN